MSLDYLANVVSNCQYMIDSQLSPKIMQQALAHRSIPPLFLNENKIGRGLNDRGRKQTEWKVRTEIELSDLQKLENWDSVRKPPAIIGGYPVRVNLDRTETDVLFIGFMFNSFWPDAEKYTDDENDDDLPPFPDGYLMPGAAAQICYKLRNGPEHTLSALFQGDGTGWGKTNYTPNSWEEDINAESPLFTDGKCLLEATITLLKKA